MALAKRNEGAKVNSDINVTPMVDVMLVLLIIFMVVTPMLQWSTSAQEYLWRIFVLEAWLGELWPSGSRPPGAPSGSDTGTGRTGTAPASPT